MKYVNTTGFRPQQGLPIMNGLKIVSEAFDNNDKGFPSPTGATYYEYEIHKYNSRKNEIRCFRPQQGLPIMNLLADVCILIILCFRPQQGLPIMNPYLQNPDKHYLK